MKFLGLEVGSLAEWFSGTLTALGVIYAVYASKNKYKTKYSFKVEVTSKGSLRISYTSNNDISVRIQTYGYKVFSKRYRGEQLAIDDKNLPRDKRIILEPGDLINYKQDYLNPEYLFKSREFVWIEPYILDTTGVWKVSGRRTKVRVTNLESTETF